MPNHVLQLDRLLAESLGQFVKEIKRNNWQGKERDCVNRFAMGYLVPACSDHHFLKHPTQIGIEMAVGKPRRIGTKPIPSQRLGHLAETLGNVLGRELAAFAGSAGRY
jgi:hypothetical protein